LIRAVPAAREIDSYERAASHPRIFDWQSSIKMAGNAPKVPTVKILEYNGIEPFFVKGESHEP
jgi:hypothetical protein